MYNIRQYFTFLNIINIAGSTKFITNNKIAPFKTWVIIFESFTIFRPRNSYHPDQFISVFRGSRGSQFFWYRPIGVSLRSVSLSFFYVQVTLDTDLGDATWCFVHFFLQNCFHCPHFVTYFFKIKIKTDSEFAGLDQTPRGLFKVSSILT